MKCLSLPCTWAVLALVAVCPTLALAAKPVSNNPANQAKAPPADAVDIFAAMKSGDIEVKVIPKDTTAGVVTITNKTKKPLTIKLPEVFASVPVAAQFGGGGDPNAGGGGGGGNQGMGGGGMMGGGGGGMMGGGMGGGGGGGGGFFNVAPEKVGKLTFVGVCLEHGKKDPNPRVPYTLAPLETLNSDPQVAETLKMLGRREIDQHSAQAAAWHLANGMSWEQLARKVGAKHIGGGTDPFFTSAHIQRGMKIAHEAKRRVDESQKSQSSSSAGKQVSLSQQ